MHYRYTSFISKTKKVLKTYALHQFCPWEKPTTYNTKGFL
eukprot:UN15179